MLTFRAICVLLLLLLHDSNAWVIIYWIEFSVFALGRRSAAFDIVHLNCTHNMVLDTQAVNWQNSQCMYTPKINCILQRMDHHHCNREWMRTGSWIYRESSIYISMQVLCIHNNFLTAYTSYSVYLSARRQHYNDGCFCDCMPRCSWRVLHRNKSITTTTIMLPPTSTEFVFILYRCGCEINLRINAQSCLVNKVIIHFLLDLKC